MQNVNIYDIYRFCYIADQREFTTTVGGEERTYKAGMTKYEYTPWKFGARSTAEHHAAILKAQDEGLLGETPPCVYSAGASHFLNNQTVRAALHIPEGVQAWDMCAGPPFDYSPAANGSYWIYPELKEAGIKILFFSGDTDGAVGTLGKKMDNKNRYSELDEGSTVGHYSELVTLEGEGRSCWLQVGA